MVERIVTNVHKESGVISMLYGPGWKPRSKEAVVAEMGWDKLPKRKYVVRETVVKDEVPGNPIRPVHGDHGVYLRTDPNTSRTNLGALKEPSRLEGFVKDKQGEPVKQAEVVLLDPRGEEQECDWLKSQANSRGYFGLDGVPQGTWKLVVRVEGSVRVEKTLKVRPRSLQTLAILIKPGCPCSICGRWLTNLTSVRAGMGPVCAGRQAR